MVPKETVFEFSSHGLFCLEELLTGSIGHYLLWWCVALADVERTLSFEYASLAPKAHSTMPCVSTSDNAPSRGFLYILLLGHFLVKCLQKIAKRVNFDTETIEISSDLHLYPFWGFGVMNVNFHIKFFSSIFYCTLEYGCFILR
ncbi:hypothetical protein TNCV_1665321 [Trichonephila clavipes]|nr:hypothetical protein TNCV_1665321 [Trichonephila clavipes]